MATSGNFMGSRTTTNGPQLYLEWSRIERDIANNRSKLRLTLKVYSEYDISFGGTKHGKLQGKSFSFSGGMTSPGYRGIKTIDIWVNHNSDGSKSVNLSAEFDIKVSWGSGYVSKITVSGTANLDTIPRASKITSFNNFVVKHDTQTTINLGIDRADSSFHHSIYLHLDGVEIQSWANQGTPTSLSTYSTRSNNMLNLMSNVEYSTGARLRVITYDANGNKIGDERAYAHAEVHVDEIPSVSGLSRSIYGSGRDKTIGKYVQSISRVALSMSPSPGYGASITIKEITIRKIDGSNSMTISGNSGNSGILTKSGSYEVYGYVKDSRGRAYKSPSLNITVEDYSPPTITDFKVARDSDIPTEVLITRYGTISNIDGLNTSDIYLERRTGSGNWDTITGGISGFTGAAFGTVIRYGGNNVATSYEFRLRIVDSFNNVTEKTVTVSTQRVLMDKHKDLGMGFGKLHERGDIDVVLGYFEALRIGDDDVVSSGSNSSGRWVRLCDGTQIVYVEVGFDKSSPDLYVNPPADFSHEEVYWNFASRSTSYSHVQDTSLLGVGGGKSYCRIMKHTDHGGFRSNTVMPLAVIGFGRWK